jgi:hypothetical protein
MISSELWFTFCYRTGSATTLSIMTPFNYSKNGNIALNNREKYTLGIIISAFILSAIMLSVVMAPCLGVIVLHSKGKYPRMLVNDLKMIAR